MKNRALVESVLSLSILNILNMVLPLITLPYLLRTVGLSNYGAYSIVYTIIQYALLISQYSFQFSTTRAISMNRDNKEKINEIFNSTVFARLFLSIVSILVFGVVISLYNKPGYILMYLYGIGIILGDAINPQWLFQGLEKMRYMTVVNVICKVIFTVLIFVFIQCESDYIYISLLNALGFILSGIVSLWLAHKSFKISFYIPKISSVFFQIKEGWYIFISNLFINFYRNSNVLILSLFLPEASVGMYTSAEKMIKAAQSVASPISNAFYPHFANKVNNGSIIMPLLKLSKYMTVLLLLISLVSFLGADILNRYFLDPDTPYIATLIRIMSPVILFGGLNYILGIVGLVNIGKQKCFTKSVVISGCASIIFLLITVNFWGAAAAGWAMVVSEILLTFLCVRYLFLK